MASATQLSVSFALLLLLLLLLVNRLSTSARKVVLVRSKPQSILSSGDADTLLMAEAAREVERAEQRALLQRSLPSDAPPPPSLRAVAAKAAVARAAMRAATAGLADAGVESSPPPPCNRLSCTTKLQSLEPDWVQLSFQPRIDWKGGGVRGDCLVGEYQYMMQSPYCTPPGQPAPTGKKWPSPERLEAADVHSQALPQSQLAEVAAQLPDQTLMLMGDSVMEQFYNALQCMLRREGLERPTDAAFRAFIRQNEPLWKMGKRKMPPKLPQQATSGMRMLFARAINYQPEDLAAALQTAHVIVLNWGLHYHNMTQYRLDLHTAFAHLDRHAAAKGHAVLFMETGAQHFRMDDNRGYGRLRSASGEWEFRDQRTDRHCSCAPIEDFGVNRQNGVLHDVLGTGKYPHVKVLPFYELTRPRWRWHFGNCTHRPSGWNYDRCCDCSHFCYSPAMWRAHLHSLRTRLVV